MGVWCVCVGRVCGCGPLGVCAGVWCVSVGIVKIIIIIIIILIIFRIKIWTFKDFSGQKKVKKNFKT